MRQVLGMLKHQFILSSVAAGSFGIPLLMAGGLGWQQQGTSLLVRPSLAQAAHEASYQPPPDAEPPKRATVGGSRGGCTGDAPIDLTALAPQSHIGRTASTRPTLVWFVPDATPYPLQLQLYRYTSAEAETDQLEPVQSFDFEQSQPGYMTFTLPADAPALTVGETYRWKVILFCNPGRPSQVNLDEADLQVVGPPAGLEAIAADSSVAQAAQYVAAGLWYDAIAVLSQAPVSPAAAAYRSELVADLAQLETANPNDEWSQFSERLRYIAESRR